MAPAAAVRVARAAATPSAAAVERAVVPEAVVGTIDGLSTRSRPARRGGVVQALAGVPASDAEGDTSMVGSGRAGAHERKHGGGSQPGRRLESLTARRTSRECTDDGIEAIGIHSGSPIVLLAPRSRGAASRPRP